MNNLIIFSAEYFIYIAVIWTATHILIKHSKKDYIKNFIIIFGTSILAWGVTHFLKDIIAHPRPDLNNALFMPDSLYSFPSGHATFMFALAFGVLNFNRRDGYIILALAVLTGIARVLSGVHFWYDIVGGIVVGAIVSSIVVYISKRFLK